MRVFIMRMRKTFEASSAAPGIRDRARDPGAGSGIRDPGGAALHVTSVDPGGPVTRRVRGRPIRRYAARFRRNLSDLNVDLLRAMLRVAVVVVVLLWCSLEVVASPQFTIDYDNDTFLKDGKPFR